MKKTNKILSIFLALLMIVSIIPMSSIKAEAAESWLWPIAGYTNWTTYENHRGIDIPTPSGIPIRATKSGTLFVYNNTCNGSHYGASPACTISGCNSTTGKCVYIIHNDGTASCYMHMVSLAITTTKVVKQGDVIGYVGTTGPSTGNHLHFEVAKGSGTNYWSYSLMNPGSLTYVYNTSIATTGIKINDSAFSLNVGESKTLSATVSPSNATNKTVTWSSNDTNVATVSSSGVVKAVSPGVCTITAKASGGQTASVVVIVRNESHAPVTSATYNGHYYELYDDVLSWKEAKEYCESLGGHLVTITSQNENNFVQGLTSDGTQTNYYIGGTDEETEGTWKWVTGEAFSYINLGDGEPSATEYEKEDYLFIGKSDGKWRDIVNITGGVKVYGFICEYDTLDNIIFEEIPEGEDPDNYEEVVAYRSRDKQTTTSTSSALDGWTLYDSQTTYGTWSTVQSTATKPTESDTLQITGTWKQYHYYHYCNYYSNQWNIDSIACGSSSVRHDTYLNQKLPAFNFQDQGGQQAYGGQGASGVTACDYNFYVWFYAGEKTFYNYQTRTKSTTNYFYKWSDWSQWTDTPISSTDTKQVEVRTGYRLKGENGTENPDIPDIPDTPITPDTEYVFHIQSPSTTSIRHKDGIKLHANIEGTAPAGSYVVWTSDNNNFKTEEINNGNSLKIVSDSNGKTTFTATLYSADCEILATDSIEMKSKAGFFDKIGGFFRYLFGTTKVYEY